MRVGSLYRTCVFVSVGGVFVVVFVIVVAVAVLTARARPKGFRGRARSECKRQGFAVRTTCEATCFGCVSDQ